MAGRRDERKEKLRRKAEELIEQLLEWEEENPQPTLTQLEDEILELRKALGQEMARLVLEEQENGEPVPGPSCEQCGKERRYKGRKKNQVASRIGEIEVERGTITAPIAKRGFFPLDQQLVVLDRNWSEQVAKHAVWLSGLMDFEQAAEVLQELGQIEISDSSVWRLAQKWGERIKQQEAKEQEQAYHLPENGENLRRMKRSKGRMGISMDGTMIHIRTEGWKEVKVGCLFDVIQLSTVDPLSQERIQLGHARHTTYVSHLGGPEVLGRKLWTEADRRDWDQAVDTQVVADAAVWIWNLTQEHFYASHQVVDWYHASEHLARAAQLMFGEGTPASQRWLKEHKTVLFQGHADRIAERIAQAAKEHPQQAQSLLEQATYFERNKRRMAYLDLRAEGWLIGSGSVESCAKQIKARFAGPGMRWSRVGAERLLPVRTALMSKCFNHCWHSVYNSPLN